MSLIAKLFAVSVLVLPPMLAVGQDLMSFLKDPKFPQRIKSTDLGEDMRAVKIVYEKQNGGDYFSMVMNPMISVMGAFGRVQQGDVRPEEQRKADYAWQAAQMKFLDRLGLSWTNGATVTLYGQEFLVTYRVDFDMAKVDESDALPNLGRNDLVLTLVNTKDIESITPRPEITKTEWLKPPAAPPQGSPEKERTLANIKQLAVGAMMYAADYDDVFPYAQSSMGAFESIWPYTRNVEAFKSAQPGAKFLMNMALAGVKPSSISQPQETVLFYEDTEWPDGMRAVAFADGSAKFVNRVSWTDLQSSLKLKLPKVGKPLPSNLGRKLEERFRSGAPGY